MVMDIQIISTHSVLKDEAHKEIITIVKPTRSEHNLARKRTGNHLGMDSKKAPAKFIKLSSESVALENKSNLEGIDDNHSWKDHSYVYSKLEGNIEEKIEHIKTDHKNLVRKVFIAKKVNGFHNEKINELKETIADLEKELAPRKDEDKIFQWQFSNFF